MIPVILAKAKNHIAPRNKRAEMVGSISYAYKRELRMPREKAMCSGANTLRSE